METKNEFKLGQIWPRIDHLNYKVVRCNRKCDVKICTLQLALVVHPDGGFHYCGRSNITTKSIRLKTKEEILLENY